MNHLISIGVNNQIWLSEIKTF